MNLSVNTGPTITRRVSYIAREFNVLSRDVIRQANLAGIPVKSASSNVTIGPDNAILWEVILTRASELRSSETNLIRKTNSIKPEKAPSILPHLSYPKG